MIKRFNAFTLIVLCIALLMPSCRLNPESFKSAGSEQGYDSSFILDVDVMKFEISRKESGLKEVP